MSTYEGTRAPGHIRNLPWPARRVVDDIAMTDSHYRAAPPPLRHLALPHHRRRRGRPAAADLLSARDRQGRVVAGTPARRGRAGPRSCISARREAPAGAAAPWNARTRVHEYGGLSYLPVPAAGRAAGILGDHLRELRRPAPLPADEPGADGAGGTPRPLTPEPGGAGHPGVSFRRLHLVPRPRRGLVRTGAARRRQGDPGHRRGAARRLRGGGSRGAIRELVTGSDFYAFPTPSPDGHRLAWICWNHPRMPWDGTELRVAPIDEGVARQGQAGQGRHAGVGPGPGLARRDEPVRGHRLAGLVESLPGGPGRRARRRPSTRPRRSSPARSGSSGSARTRCWATAGSRCCTAAAGCGWAARPGHRGAGRPGHPVPGLRARAVGGRDVHRAGSRAARRRRCP